MHAFRNTTQGSCSPGFRSRSHTMQSECARRRNAPEKKCFYERCPDLAKPQASGPTPGPKITTSAARSLGLSGNRTVRKYAGEAATNRDPWPRSGSRSIPTRPRLLRQSQALVSPSRHCGLVAPSPSAATSFAFCPTGRWNRSICMPFSRPHARQSRRRALSSISSAASSGERRWWGERLVSR